MRDHRRRDANHDGISAAEMLRRFCEWQSSVNVLDDDSPYHHDTALLLTRYTCSGTAQWSLDVPRGLIFNNSVFFPQSVSVCFVWI